MIYNNPKLIDIRNKARLFSDLFDIKERAANQGQDFSHLLNAVFDSLEELAKSLNPSADADCAQCGGSGLLFSDLGEGPWNCYCKNTG